MAPAVILAIVLISASVPALLWLVAAGPGRNQRAVQANLRRGLESHHAATTQQKSHSHWGRRLSNTAQLQQLERLVARAGRPDEWPVDRVLNVKLIAGMLGLVLGTAMVLRGPSPRAVLFAMAITALAYFVPDLLLYNIGMKRRQSIALELPDTLDQMSIAVEAGLGFDAAMARVARNGKGVLAEELIRALQDVQIGQSRRAAFEALAFRANVPELRRFIRSVVQAEEYGIPLSDVLSTQAKEMRVMRRQRAEHKAAQIPVKVTMPLILFILPVLFIVILGPAAISVLNTFS